MKKKPTIWIKAQILNRKTGRLNTMKWVFEWNSISVSCKPIPVPIEGYLNRFEWVPSKAATLTITGNRQ